MFSVNKNRTFQETNRNSVQFKYNVIRIPYGIVSCAMGVAVRAAAGVMKLSMKKLAIFLIIKYFSTVMRLTPIRLLLCSLINYKLAQSTKEEIRLCQYRTKHESLTGID